MDKKSICNLRNRLEEVHEMEEKLNVLITEFQVEEI